MKTRKFFQFFLILAILASFSSCRTVRVIEQVPVEVHDTISQKVFLHDSTYIDRWHTVEVKGDTIYITDEVTKTVTKKIVDTLYRYVEKPVTVTRTETVEVKKPLVWWQKGLMHIGALGIFMAALAIVIRLRKPLTH